MSTRAQDVSGQSPTPNKGPEGSDLRSVANQIEGLLDDDGQFNPDPNQVSRGHPDYDESADPRAQRSTDRDDKGRYKKAAAADDDAEPGESTDEDPEALAADTGEDQDADTDGEAGGDTEEDLAASADDDATTDDADTGTLESLEQLAAELDIPLEELKDGLSHTFRAADEDVTVTLAELEKGYQKDADYRRSTAKLADDRRAAETDYSLRMQQFETANQQLAGQFEYAEQLVAAELNDPRLTGLRESDPAEWTARREEIGQRLAALRGNRNQIAAAYDQFSGQQLHQLKGRELQALTTAIPEWSADHQGIARDVMGTLGYSGQEIGQVFDHRMIKGALELAALRSEVKELRAMKSSAADTVKRVKKDVPKLQKPGKQRKAGARVKRDNLARLRTRAKKSGRVEDAAKVIETMI